MQFHFRLEDTDEDEIRFWLSVPKGQRSDLFRRMTRWYGGIEGFGAVVAALEVRTPPSPDASVPPPNFSELVEDALSQFGFDE